MSKYVVRVTPNTEPDTSTRTLTQEEADELLSPPVKEHSTKKPHQS